MDAALIHVDGRTDGHQEGNCAFHDIANVPKKRPWSARNLNLIFSLVAVANGTFDLSL